MKLRDLITAPDDSLSLTKLAAATAHFLMAVSFLRLQVLGDSEFNETMWLVYGGFAIAHASYDKTAAMVKDFKEKKLDAVQGTHPAGEP